MKEFVEKLISRLEEEVTATKTKCPVNVEFDIGIYKAIEIVNQLAEEYNNGWIPCSEKLPEEGKAVLTCDKDGWISVRINMKYNGKKNDFECGYYEAWMPLPEPYKKGE